MTIALCIVEIAALAGNPARANMLSALIDGRRLSAGDLAYEARVTPQTASAHLAKLVEARLLVDEKQGRYRHFRLASPKVARMLEAIMILAADSAPRHRPAWLRDPALRLARTCYDHLAGRLGVALADALIERGHAVLDGDGGRITGEGTRFFAGFGVDLTANGRRRFCRPCIDWSEQRPHLAGAVGAALARHCFSLGWIERVKHGRAVRITPSGLAGFRDSFGISPSDDA